MLNKEAFVTLAGNPEKWDHEMAALQDGGEGLCRLQESQSQRGYLPAHLVESIHGWCVRYASGLQGFGIIYGYRTTGRPISREEAIRFGKAWAAADPAYREFYARKSDLEKPDKFAA